MPLKWEYDVFILSQQFTRTKNVAEDFWDTRSKLMHRHAHFPSIMSLTPFGSLHNCPSL